MNKKIIFEGIFILVLIFIGTYLIFAIEYGGSTYSLDPANNSNLSTKNTVGFFEYNFTCNATTWSAGEVIQNLSLWANFNGTFSQNLTNKTTVRGNDSIGFNVTQVADGTYIWACRSENINGTIDRSINRTVTIDITKPSVTNFTNLTWVSNNTNMTGTNIGTQSDWAFITTANDLQLVNCSLWGDFNGSFSRNSTNLNTTTSGQKIMFLSAGKSYIVLNANNTGYTYGVTCTDATNHTSTIYNRTLLVDGLYPIGNISTENSTSLTTYTNWSDETLNISAIVGDVINGVSSGIANCSLWGDFNGIWGRNISGQVVTDNVEFDFKLNVSSNTAGYNYNVECKDVANNRKNLSTGLRIIRVDAEAPSLTLTSSAGTSLGLGQTTTLSCSGSDDSSGVATTTIDLCPGSASSCTYTMATTSSQTATCTVADQLGHSTATSLILASSEGGTGGTGTGGGGSGGGGASTEISTEPTTVTSTGIGEVIPLTIGGEGYNLEVKSVGLTSTTLTIADKTISLVLGESKEVDLNNDGSNDIKITLNSVANKKPQFTIKEISLQTGGEEVTTQEVQELGEPKSKFSAISIGILALVLAIVIIIIIYVIERRR